MRLPDSLEHDPAALARFYAYPEPLTQPWVRANFIASVDGAAAVDGRSGGLGHPSDRSAYELIRELADVIVVGAGTAIAENYGGATGDPDRVARRVTAGLSGIPPIAVVTGGGSLSPDADVLTRTEVPSVVVTCTAVGRGRIADYRAAGADVVVAGDTAVDFSRMLAEFGARGWLRVVSEGGPKTFAAMVADALVDELCLTVSPLLTGGGGIGVLDGVLPRPQSLRLNGVWQHDSAVLLRYYTRRALDRLGEASCG